ncbi:MAG: hypothetical protein ACYC67_04845 [Prosthecobacter sp.]
MDLCKVRKLLPLLGLLLFTTSCMHKKAVVLDHDPSSGQDIITYRGKPMTPEELFELGEKAGDNQIDLIMKQDGTTQKVDLKKWHTGMRMLPEVMQSMPGDVME